MPRNEKGIFTWKVLELFNPINKNFLKVYYKEDLRKRSGEKHNTKSKEKFSQVYNEGGFTLLKE